MNKQTIANAIFTRAFELEDVDMTTEDCDELAEAVIAAAGIGEALTQLAEIREAHTRIVAGQCAPDEKHCTCVPALRARIAEMEDDSRRLRWLMRDIDGFDGLDTDRHEQASMISSNRGHVEPTDDDEFDGWRKMIDMAMGAQERTEAR